MFFSCLTGNFALKNGGDFWWIFSGLRLPRNEARKVLEKFGENSEQNSGQNSGQKFKKFGKLSFCNFPDLRYGTECCRALNCSDFGAWRIANYGLRNVFSGPGGWPFHTPSIHIPPAKCQSIFKQPWKLRCVMHVLWPLQGLQSWSYNTAIAWITTSGSVGVLQHCYCMPFLGQGQLERPVVIT